MLKSLSGAWKLMEAASCPTWPFGLRGPKKEDFSRLKGVHFEEEGIRFRRADTTSFRSQMV